MRSATSVLEAMIDMFATGDPTYASEVVADHYLDHQGLSAGPIRGADGFAHVVRTNAASYVSHEVIVEDLFGEDDRAVARIRWRGTRHDGTEVDRRTIDIIRTEDGRAVEHWGART